MTEETRKLARFRATVRRQDEENQCLVKKIRGYEKELRDRNRTIEELSTQLELLQVERDKEIKDFNHTIESLRLKICNLIELTVRTEPERTEPERTEPERTEPERTEPERTEVSKVKEDSSPIRKQSWFGWW